ncbi:MAG: hypothetical protein V1653_01315 [bacterium]
MNAKLQLELKFVLTAFIVSLFYEIIQSHLYNFYLVDPVVGNSLFKGIIFITLRIFLDIFVLLVNFNIIARAKKNILWFQKIEIRDMTLFILLGVVYVQYNEVINVYFLHTWGYQKFMPLVPVFKIGLAPFIQWVILAPLVLLMYRDWFHADPAGEY